MSIIKLRKKSIKLSDVSGFSAYILDNQYVVEYNKSIIKKFDIINISSDKYDLDKPYLMNFNGIFDIYMDYLGRYIKCLKCKLRVDFDNNKVKIIHDDILLKEYDYVSVIGDYDFSKSYLESENGILGIYAEFLVQNINFINCSFRFNLRDSKVYMLYNNEIVKEYDVIKG